MRLSLIALFDLRLDVELEIILVRLKRLMLALTGKFVSHMPMYLLMLRRAIKQLAAKTTALVCLFLANHAFLHQISLTFFIITNKNKKAKCHIKII